MAFKMWWTYCNWLFLLLPHSSDIYFSLLFKVGFDPCLQHYYANNTYIHTSTHTCIHRQTDRQTHACKHAHINTLTRTEIQTHTNTLIHAHTNTHNTWYKGTLGMQESTDWWDSDKLLIARIATISESLPVTAINIIFLSTLGIAHFEIYMDAWN